jgi:hypothetical protein
MAISEFHLNMKTLPLKHSEKLMFIVGKASLWTLFIISVHKKDVPCVQNSSTMLIISPLLSVRAICKLASGNYIYKNIYTYINFEKY